jgi:hypothetical protein
MENYIIWAQCFWSRNWCRKFQSSHITYWKNADRSDSSWKWYYVLRYIAKCMEITPFERPTLVQLLKNILPLYEIRIFIKVSAIKLHSSYRKKIIQSFMNIKNVILHNGMHLFLPNNLFPSGFHTNKQYQHRAVTDVSHLISVPAGFLVSSNYYISW